MGEQSVAKIQAVMRGKMARAETKDRFSEEQRAKLDRTWTSASNQRDFFKDFKETLGVSKEDYNSRPAIREAQSYLEKHKIQGLFDNLLAHVALERPADLRGFMTDVLLQMKADAGKPKMGFFTEEDLECMFDMWDVPATGKVPATKVAESLKACQCAESDEEALQKVEAALGKPL